MASTSHTHTHAHTHTHTHAHTNADTSVFALTGIISCMAFPPDGSMLAAGTYAGYVGTFDPRTPPHAQLQMLLHGHKGGLTQVSARCKCL